MADPNAQPFDPGRFIRQVNGGDYLEVKWRLVWLRDRHPDAEVETILVSHDIDREAAIFKAVVRLPTGGLATGYGSETGADFRDYIEKAETKAIGRALASLGFGTQFAPDHDFGVDQGRVVDAPARRPAAEPGGVRAMNGQQAGNAAQAARPRAAQPSSGAVEMATPGQVKFIGDLFRDKLLYVPNAITARLLMDYGVEAAEQLTKRQAMELIPRLRHEAGMPAD